MSPSPSPTTGFHPVAATVATSGPSGVTVTVHTGRSVPVKRDPKSSCSWGKVRPSGTSHVRASDDARSASSARRSAARSRIRRGSTRSTWAPAGSRSTIVRSSSASQGSQLSIPSNNCPSARRSHCSRPHGSAATRAAARSRTSSVGSSSRHGNSSITSRSSVERWSLTENAVSRSTSSPHRSMRTGPSSVDPNTSTIDPRTANSPRCSTWPSRRYPCSASHRTSAAWSRCSPGRTTSGSVSSTWGPRRCTSARTGATTTAGCSAALERRRQMVRSGDPWSRSRDSPARTGASPTPGTAPPRRRRGTW